MKAKFNISALFSSVLVTFLANGYLLYARMPVSLFFAVPAFILINVFAGVLIQRPPDKKLRVCQHGTVLLYAFYVSVLISPVFHIWLAFNTPDGKMTLLWSAAVCVAVNFIIFWNGMICVYIASAQLRLKWRVIGLLCGMIPVANLIALYYIIKITADECLFEEQKEKINSLRKSESVCATKYPVLLVHGVFFRDTKYFNYWGRIPSELEANGATLFYGNHSSAASVADSAAELKERIEVILAETGAEKVNIIAHSKGGLDCRYAVSKLGIADKVASLTTVNTPHRGCLFADYLLTKAPDGVKNGVASAYNAALKKFGEANPDFLAAVNDLTNTACEKLNAELADPDGVFCQSVGSLMHKAAHGQFPLNFSYHLVKHFSGANDGLVSTDSFEWGEKYTLVEPAGKRGVSHGDMIDLNRENIRGFDVREFYVGLVADLKSRGF